MSKGNARPPRRRLPVGAEAFGDGVHFRVWAPDRKQVEVVVERLGAFPLERERGGYFSGKADGARAGDTYRFRLDGSGDYPDPASRFQPDGPHGPSVVVDPGKFAWSDADWPGAAPKGQVIYEMHVGTFTPEGTWAAAAKKLRHLVEIGVTVLEMMPIAEFPGQFGWGYDGVNLFAPSRLYGTPDDLRRFVDRAHQAGLAVILDVVYNHLGPDGNYLSQFARDYFSKRYENEWGDAINFDGDNAAGVRELYLANAAYWIDEFHFDGLRLDATQSVHDASGDHILAGLVAAARRAAGARRLYIVAENERQDARLARSPDVGGYGIDALWNDDFHHSARVALTGHREAYYSDHAGAPQEFIAAAKHGFLFQGQRYSWQGAARGHPALDLPPTAFITFLDNHDQVANTADGRRIAQRTTPGRARAMTAMLLLLPATPMLFQGQEFGATTPFLYFADLPGELAEAVKEGRKVFLRQFPSLADPAIAAHLADPGNRETFRRCRLDWSERERNAEALALHSDLLLLRRTIAAFRAPRHGGIDGSVLGAEAMLFRFFAEDGQEALLLVNLGVDLALKSIADPLGAPPDGRAWRLAWSSEDPKYGGAGTPEIEAADGWHLPGHAAMVLLADPRPQE